MEDFVQIQHTDTDITVTETEYVFHMKRPRDFAFSKGEQDYHLVALILSGSAQYRMNRKTFTVQKGDVVFFRKGTHYNAKVISNELWEHIVIAFRTDGDRQAGGIRIKIDTDAAGVHTPLVKTTGLLFEGSKLFGGVTLKMDACTVFLNGNCTGSQSADLVEGKPHRHHSLLFSQL